MLVCVVVSESMCSCCFFFCFFFQAEDGIRDLVRSRGLGDVYKRQAAYNIKHMRAPGMPFHPRGTGNGYVVTFGDKRVSVSYTHLTLPTIYSV